MSRSRRHGRRPHRASCDCKAKGTCYTTWDAAMAGVSETPDAERAYRGKCCGHWHITRYTVDEYAQRVAEFGGVQAGESVVQWYYNELEEANDEPRHDSEPRTREGDAGEAPVVRGQPSRLAPSPATLARRLQAR